MVCVAMLVMKSPGVPLSALKPALAMLLPDATLSTVMLVLALGLVLPQASVWLALMDSGPWPKVATSAVATRSDQLPSLPTSTLLPPSKVVPLAKARVIVAPASACPVMSKPAVFSAALTWLLPAMVLMTGVAGGLVSNKANSEARLSVAEPSSASAAIAASMAFRLLLFTPLTPISAKSAALRAVVGMAPAAVSAMALAMRARLLMALTVSTPVAACAPTMSLSRARLCTLLAAAPMAAPIRAYCAAPGWTPGVASAAGPLASARICR